MKQNNVFDVSGVYNHLKVVSLAAKINCSYDCFVERPPGCLLFLFLCLFYLLQGTILDRIDYNIEHASVQVEKGLQQLQKAQKYQKKNRKMLIVVILTCVIILLIIILVAVKS